jgi:hypothetical protein
MMINDMTLCFRFQIVANCDDEMYDIAWIWYDMKQWAERRGQKSGGVNRI